MLAAYRRTGADLPFGDPVGAHDVGFEGYFWRITHPRDGWVAIVMLGVNRDRAGRPWGTVGLAAHPGGFVRTALVGHAEAARQGLRVRAGATRADARSLTMDLGDDARIDLRIAEPVAWPRRAFGGVGLAHAVPGLSQYWHPYLLDGTASGTARFGDLELDLAGARVYGEKNWGAGGFPERWWWGQAHGFARDDVCVAFAGGRAGVGRAQFDATALVVRVGDELIRIVRPLRPLDVRVDDEGWLLAGRTARHRVEMRGHANGTPPHLLPVPLPADRRHLEGAAAQHLAGEVELRVLRGRRTLFEGTSRLAGLERSTPAALNVTSAPLWGHRSDVQGDGAVLAPASTSS
ncbi:MAG: hypothetical protein JHC95_18570 [Solirubrobacteraceae bacterium]|nr:hypothetical protein [Solirubrobacteraceae bacterium]